MTIFRLYEEIFIKSSNWNIAVFEFCTPIQQRGSIIHISQFNSVTQSIWVCDPWSAAGQASLSITNSQSLLKLMSIESVMPCNHLTLCCPLSSSIFPSIRVFLSGSFLHIRWPKSELQLHYVLLMNIQDWFPLGLTGLISCIQGTLKNLLQHHSSKASILQHSAFFMVQLSYPYVTTGKTIVLTRWTFVGKLISLAF